MHNFNLQLKCQLVWVLAGLLVVTQPVHTADISTDTGVTYRLGPGDLIQIRVFNEEDLDMDVRLGSSGVISYPFLGDLKIDGLTVGDVEKVITKGLKGPYLVNPIVNITVAEYRHFFIYGEVRSPGKYAYEPGLTLRKAVALAGGFTDRAAISKVIVIREGDPKGEEQKISLEGAVGPGDVIKVDQSFF